MKVAITWQQLATYESVVEIDTREFLEWNTGETVEPKAFEVSVERATNEEVLEYLLAGDEVWENQVDPGADQVFDYPPREVFEVRSIALR